jgi:hypothetical protein
MDSSYLMLFRGSERLLIVGAGWFSIFLGYRLFQSLPDFHGSQGKLEAFKLSVTLSKVGPGVFFALFGAFILWRSTESVMVIRPQDAPYAQSGQGYETLTYLGPDTRGAEADHVRADISVLNCLSQNIPIKVKAIGQAAIDTALHNARVQMLANAWQPEWGGRSEQEALRNGNLSHAGNVADIYRAVNPRCRTEEGG